MLISALNFRALGILILILATTLPLLNRGFVSVVFLFNIHPDTDIFVLLRFVVFLLLRLLLVIFAFYAGIKNLINRPFKRNKSLGQLLVLLGVLYFIYNIATVFSGAITGLNPGGWIGTVLVILGVLVLALIGLGFSNLGGEAEPK